MLEIKLSQGAKPGKGGILPAVKVTEEIAQIRGIKIGKIPSAPMVMKTFARLMIYWIDLRKCGLFRANPQALKPYWAASIGLKIYAGLFMNEA